MNIIYLHGFNSDGDGWKATALRRHFPTANVLAPDLPAHPSEVEAIVNFLIDQSESPPMLIGSSLGGFYAYCASARYGIPAYLFNPSLHPYQTLQGRGIGQFKTWTKGRDYNFKANYLPILERMKAVADQQIDPSLLHFYLATDDEVLDLSPIPTEHPTAATEWIAGAGHGFSKFEKILKQWK